MAKKGQNSQTLSVDPLTIRGRTYKKHQTHWYTDGNIAFLVGNVAFRVHGSLLSRRSPVIADLLQIPTPTYSSVTAATNRDVVIEGLPFVPLQDSAVNFAHVLDFIYPNALPGAVTLHLGLADLIGMARLANKYLIDDVLKWTADKLAKDKLLLVKENGSWKEALSDKGRYGTPEFSTGIIKFSRECSLPQFLPAAFYALATTDWEAFPNATQCIHQLESADKSRVYSGRVALMEAVLRKPLATSEFGEALAKCRSWGCKKPSSNNKEERYTSLILHPIEELEGRSMTSYSLLCQECRKNRVTELRDFRKELLDGLEVFFGL